MNRYFEVENVLLHTEAVKRNAGKGHTRQNTEKGIVFAVPFLCPIERCKTHDMKSRKNIKQSE